MGIRHRGIMSTRKGILRFSCGILDNNIKSEKRKLLSPNSYMSLGPDSWLSVLKGGVCSFWQYLGAKVQVAIPHITLLILEHGKSYGSPVGTCTNPVSIKFINL